MNYRQHSRRKLSRLSQVEERIQQAKGKKGLLERMGDMIGKVSGSRKKEEITPRYTDSPEENTSDEEKINGIRRYETKDYTYIVKIPNHF